MSDAFAAKAADWDQNPVRAAVGQAFAAEVLRAASAHFPTGLAGLNVLEFGCGTGQLGLHLAKEHGARLFFVDTSAAMLAVLREKIAAQGLATAQVFEGDLGDQAMPAASVDLIVSLMALHHVEDVPGVLRPLRQTLKPGGLALFGDLLPEDGSFHGPEAVPHNGFDPADLARLLADAGFSPLAQRGFHSIEKPDASGAPRTYPLFFLAATTG